MRSVTTRDRIFSALAFIAAMSFYLLAIAAVAFKWRIFW